MGRVVRAVHAWPDNAALIADVARLGYLDGVVLDATFGRGRFWTRWRPERLVELDLATRAMMRGDYRRLPFRDRQFDAVVFDPPYRLHGRPDQGEFDDRYGLRAMRWQDRMRDIVEGAVECWRVARRFLLVKCQDQVCAGQVRWQTDEITCALAMVGARKRDRFDLVTGLRAQPERPQRHARRNCSTLLVFERGYDRGRASR